MTRTILVEKASRTETSWQVVKAVGIMENLTDEEQYAEKKGSKIKHKKGGHKKSGKKDKKSKKKESKRARANVEEEEAMVDFGTSRDVEHEEVPQKKIEVVYEKETEKETPKELEELIDPRYEGFYDIIQNELTKVREALVDHQQQMVEEASSLIWKIPHPPQAYITRLCCCTKCCGRCCDIYGHQKQDYHRRPPETCSVGTDSKEEDESVTETKDIKKAPKKKGVILDVEPDISDSS